jgi:hypothetical protein
MSAIPTGKLNQSLKQRKQNEITARKQQKNQVFNSKLEVSMGKLPDMDKSSVLMGNHLDNNCLSDEFIRVNDNEHYTAYELMMPDFLKPKPVTKQVLPEEINTKIENIFKENAKYHRQYICLLLYYNGMFTVKEIASYFNLDEKHGHKTVDGFIKEARKKIISALTAKELHRIKWWLRLTREELPPLPIPTEGTLEYIDYKLKYDRPVIDKSNYNKAIQNGEVRNGKLVNGVIVWDN